MANLFPDHWPLTAFQFFTAAAVLVLFCVILAELASAWKRRQVNATRALLQQLSDEYSAPTVYVEGDHEAVALTPRHMHWLDTYTPRLSFSLPLADVTQVRLIDQKKNRMSFAFKLRSGTQTRVITTRDVLQAVNLFSRMAAEGKPADFLLS